MNATPKLSQVTVFYEDDGESDYIVHTDDIDRFVQARVRLNYDPGMNPHSNRETSRARAIEVSDLTEPRSYWWSTPDLQTNGDPRGARVYSFDVNPRRVWESPEEKARREAEERAEAEAEEAEYAAG